MIADKEKGHAIALRQAEKSRYETKKTIIDFLSETQIVTTYNPYEKIAGELFIETVDSSSSSLYGKKTLLPINEEDAKLKAEQILAVAEHQERYGNTLFDIYVENKRISIKGINDIVHPENKPAIEGVHLTDHSNFISIKELDAITKHYKKVLNKLAVLDKDLGKNSIRAQVRLYDELVLGDENKKNKASLTKILSRRYVNQK